MKRIKNPPVWGQIINFLTTVVSAVAALCMLLVDYEGSALAFFVYALFAVAALSLAYTVYLLVAFLPSLKRNILAFMERYNFTYLLLRNYGFRTVIFAIGSFAASVAFSLFNGVMGIVNRSIWYGALAAYYIALAFLRGGILSYHKGKIGNKERRSEKNDELVKIKVYKNSGIILLVLNVALSAAIAQMIFSDAHFSYIGWTVFAYAAYAFYKITMSIINLVRAHKQDDLTIRAIRDINLADATVSILALQTALLSTFGQGEINVSSMNTITGLFVSAFTIGLGVYMVVTATKKNKEKQKEKIDNEQQSV